MIEFAHWLAQTPVSQFIQNVAWIIPSSQSLHILAVAVILASIGVVTLRLNGFAPALGTISETERRFAPWVWSSLGILAATGIVQITGEPERSLNNPVFVLKMSMLVCAVAGTIAFQIGVSRDSSRFDREQGGLVRISGVAVLALWCAIAVAGRWIAYAIVE